MVSDPNQYKPIKLVLSDMDGTILAPDKTLSPATIRAVERLHQAKIPVSLVSARPPRAMLPYVRQLNLMAPCAGFNGGLIFTPDGRTERNVIFSSDIVERILHKLEALSVDVWLQNEKNWYVRDGQADLVQREQKMLGFTPQETKNFQHLAHEVNRIIVTCPDKALIAHLESHFGQVFRTEASILRSTPIKLNITPIKATKGQALKDIATLCEAIPENVACLGDAPNDLPMLREAGLAIAMGQSSEIVKEAATCVTGSNEKDGWAEAVEKFIIPRCGTIDAT
ncbi:Cof-type HAD-IIB family hydrolase [Saccharibacter sp. 17.LH.SD]|uniref:Cof-type HAD-IIB family hydrolase n=1 Tax=Saccharibacter sp. 17.LH.SD TaxID=2689393 RepID=UPI00136AE9FE|nr:Cof-type HAD-IIB family hydrolase [Saccharibacter sp. 17.LH.SD]MXV44002.1 Cof-type HAD-IIB family hydrolase [Saccharibacter sp. 17.LH.SD]